MSGLFNNTDSMSTILAMKRRFEDLNTDDIITEVMVASTDTIADQQAEQMFSGQKSDGSDITPQYHPLTIQEKQRKGQPTDRVTLRDTGAFYRGIQIRISGDTVHHDSTDVKTTGLEKKYGEKIFGLNDQRKREVRDLKIKPLLKQKMGEKLKLTMK